MSRDNVQITHHLQQKNLQYIRVFLDKCHKYSSEDSSQIQIIDTSNNQI